MTTARERFCSPKKRKWNVPGIYANGTEAT
jgi:hypothetical protein